MTRATLRTENHKRLSEGWQLHGRDAESSNVVNSFTDGQANAQSARTSPVGRALLAPARELGPIGRIPRCHERLECASRTCGRTTPRHLSQGELLGQPSRSNPES